MLQEEMGDVHKMGAPSCTTFGVKRYGTEEEEQFMEYIHMPESLIGSGEFFALIAKGKSMVDAGVYPDDYVIVRRQQTAENGDMVIALLDGKNNLKKLVKEDDGYILRSIIPYLRNCYELIYTSCLSGFPISSSESLAVLNCVEKFRKHVVTAADICYSFIVSVNGADGK